MLLVSSQNPRGFAAWLNVIGKTFQVVLENLLPNEWVRKLEAEGQSCLGTGKTGKLGRFAKDGVGMYQ